MEPDENIKRIARELGCITEQEFQQLVGITPSTAKAWRNRGKAPQPVLLGCRYFYPLDAIRQAITERTKETPENPEVFL